jgi:hypothetical protein
VEVSMRIKNSPNRCASVASRLFRLAVGHYIVGKVVEATIEPLGHWLYELVLRLW